MQNGLKEQNELKELKEVQDAVQDTEPAVRENKFLFNFFIQEVI